MADNERPLFAGMDELEREVAPEELAPGDPARRRADADDQGAGMQGYEANEAPSAAPVGLVGTSASGTMAAPNIGHVDQGGAPGDPQTQAADPLAKETRDVKE
ncbi:MAG: hypothetical protein ABIQ44_09520 [Chloroflexia bacterium]